MASQSSLNPQIELQITQLNARASQTEAEIMRLETEIEILESGDQKTYIMHRIVQIRQTIQQLNNRQNQLNEENEELREQISSFEQTISKMESEQQRQQRQQEEQEENKQNDNDASHGYSNQKLKGKCQCEMCREGIATTHNDDSHDQSLFGKFSLDVDNDFKLNLIGGSTKCGRVMANYFGYLSKTKQSKIFYQSNCLEVGSGTGIVGLTVAYLGATKVTMTDQPGVIDILRENAKQLNEYDALYDNVIQIGELLWGKTDAQKYINDEDKDGYDVLIGSDLIYAHEFIQPLVETFEVLSSVKAKKSGKHPIVFMSVIRRFKWEENFFKLMKNKFVQYKELEVGDICIYRYVRKEDDSENE